MRKIISKAEEQKKRRVNQLIIGGILILVMVLSVLGYSFGGNDEDNKKEKIIYRGFEFTKQNGFWALNRENLQFSFLYNPNEVAEINAILNPMSNYFDKPLYVYSESAEAETEIYRNLFYDNQIVQRAQNACPENEKCAGDLPVKTCSDNFIIIREKDNSEIKQEDNCVFIYGKKEDLSKLSDSFLFKIIGIQ